MLITVIIFFNVVFQSYGLFLPDLFNINSSVLTDDKCGKQLQAYVNEIESRELWALKMFDASAKLQSGYYEGNFYDLGNFDECLDIQENISVGLVKGKYCLASIAIHGLSDEFDNDLDKFKKFGRTIQPVTIPFKFHAQAGICIPAACTADDINLLLNKLSIKRLVLNESYCQTTSTRPQLTSGDIIVINIAAALAMIICSSTAYDLYLYYTKSNNKFPTLLLFSILQNGRKIFVVSNNNNQVTCLAGIRTISLMWIILAHEFLMINFIPFTNYRSVYEWSHHTSSMYILSAQLSVDTFFMLSGTVLIYVFLKFNRSFKMENIPMFYLHRYLRIVPALLALIIVHITVIKHFVSGPLYPYVSSLVGDCETYWWRLLLFLPFHNTECIPVSWYLVCDMQLFVVSPLILIPLQKHRRLVLKLVVVLILGSIAYSLFMAWYYEMAAFKKHEMYYTSTIVRAGPWLIGMVLGYIIHHYQSDGKVKLNKVSVLVLWVVSLATMFTCVFAGNHLIREPKLYKIEHIMHLGFVRPVWCMAVGWVIFACVAGYGGPVNTFLSLPVFQILSKLGYCMYLLHNSILIIFSLSTRTSVFESDARELYLFWSNYMITVALSIVWSLIFESPIIAFEKYALGEQINRNPDNIENKIEI